MTRPQSPDLAADLAAREQEKLRALLAVEREKASQLERRLLDEAREHDETIVELDRMRLVYEAALAWRVGRNLATLGALIQTIDKASEAGK